MSSSRIIGSSDVFEFESNSIDDNGLIILAYRCGTHEFREYVQIPHEIKRSQSLDHALQLLHLIAGVSYFKAFVGSVHQMAVHYSIPDNVTDFTRLVYEKGLGELLFKNNLPPTLDLNFELYESSAHQHTNAECMIQSGVLLGLGGGKDSLVAAELLSQLQVPVKTFGVNAEDILSAQAEKLKTHHTQITRTVDTNALNQLQTADGSIVLNGHVPISAILTTIGVVLAVVSETKDVVVAVERSANEPTVENYQSHDINHQWSKSSEYEIALDKIIQSFVHPSLRFYSLLRPLRELDIMRLYFTLGLAEKFKSLASSCNLSMAWTAGRESSNKLWDGTCDKCCFIYLLMSGAGYNQYAQDIMGHDLFSVEDHEHTFKSLLGLTDSKPFDCVGEIDEARESMDRAKEQIASANRFEYPATQPSILWSDAHNIPEQVVQKLKHLVEQTLLQP